MPGANYMGGKRNAARAKLKDATSRTQKGFFCRQRLAKGLIADKTNDNGFLGPKKKSEITLFHAKHNSAANLHVNRVETNRDHHPEQSHVTRTYDKDTQGQDRSTCGISEATQCAISLRSMCDRILAVPDLAGLHRNETLGNQRSLMKAAHPKEVNVTTSASSLSPPSKRTPQSWTSENDLGENSMHATHPVYFSLQLFPLSEHSNSNPLDTAGIFLDGDKSPRTPVSKYKISNCSPPLCRASSTGSKGWSPEIVTRLSSSLCNGVEEDEDIDTPGYPCLRNDCGKLRSRLFGESPLTPQDSAGGSINIPRCDLGGDMRTRQRSLSMDTSAAFTWSESPQASPSAKALRRTMSAAERREPLPGCIFDCEDPWDTIGIIMGLPRNESRSTSLEEELKSLGASGRAFGNIATSGDDFGADTLIECYSDSTSSTQFGSHEVKYAQESDVTWHWTSDDMIYDATTNRTPTSRQNPDSLLFVEGGSMHEDSRIDYTTRYLDKDRFASPFDWTSSSSPASALLEEQLKLLNPCTEDAITIPTQNHSPLPIQGPELPVAAVTDEGDCPYTEAESDHRIPSITLAFSPGHPESYLNPIDDNTIYYGPCLFSDNSDVESP